MKTLTTTISLSSYVLFFLAIALSFLSCEASSSNSTLVDSTAMKTPTGCCDCYTCRPGCECCTCLSSPTKEHPQTVLQSDMPPPAKVPSNVAIVQNSGTDELRFPCPVGLPIAAGMIHRTGADGRWASNPAYYAAGEANCWAPTESFTCSALCTNAFSTVAWQFTPKADGVRLATCPPGYVVSSCGYSGQSRDIEAYANSYPVSPSSCSCYNFFGMECVATCVPQNEVSGYQVVSTFGNGEVTATCPSNTRLLGCGYRSTGQGPNEHWWSVAPVSPRACGCYNFFGTTCYAICADYD